MISSKWDNCHNFYRPMRFSRRPDGTLIVSGCCLPRSNICQSCTVFAQNTVGPLRFHTENRGPTGRFAPRPALGRACQGEVQALLCPDNECILLSRLPINSGDRCADSSRRGRCFTKRHRSYGHDSWRYRQRLFLADQLKRKKLRGRLLCPADQKDCATCG